MPHPRTGYGSIDVYAMTYLLLLGFLALRQRSRRAGTDSVPALSASPDRYQSEVYEQVMYTGAVGRFSHLAHRAMERPFRRSTSGDVLEVGAGAGQHAPYVTRFDSYLETDIAVPAEEMTVRMLPAGTVERRRDPRRAGPAGDPRRLVRPGHRHLPAGPPRRPRRCAARVAPGHSSRGLGDHLPPDGARDAPAPGAPRGDGAEVAPVENQDHEATVYRAPQPLPRHAPCGAGGVRGGRRAVSTGTPCGSSDGTPRCSTSRTSAARADAGATGHPVTSNVAATRPARLVACPPSRWFSRASCCPVGRVHAGAGAVACPPAPVGGER